MMNKKNANLYLWLAIILIALAIIIPPQEERTSSVLKAWCSIAKERMGDYEAKGLKCALFRDNKQVSLEEADTTHASIYCELFCYDCDVDISPRGVQVCQDLEEPQEEPSEEETLLTDWWEKIPSWQKGAFIGGIILLIIVLIYFKKRKK